MFDLFHEKKNQRFLLSTDITIYGTSIYSATHTNLWQSRQSGNESGFLIKFILIMSVYIHLIRKIIFSPLFWHFIHFHWFFTSDKISFYSIFFYTANFYKQKYIVSYILPVLSRNQFIRSTKSEYILLFLAFIRAKKNRIFLSFKNPRHSLKTQFFYILIL